jgi:hypothetical protein
LFWSHFQASLDWDDAEMWLEGGIQNRWSVSKMRKARWEALGAPEDLKPKDEDIVVTEINEDLDSSEDQSPEVVGSSLQSVDAPTVNHEGPDFGDEDESRSPATDGPAEPGANIYSEEQHSVPFVRPFENLADLPADVGEAFEAFKLVVIRHKLDEWREISREDMLGTLEALKELAVAPASSDQSTF